MYFGVERDIAGELETARRGARQARLEVNRQTRCETCREVEVEPGAKPRRYGDLESAHAVEIVVEFDDDVREGGAGEELIDRSRTGGVRRVES